MLTFKRKEICEAFIMKSPEKNPLRKYSVSRNNLRAFTLIELLFVFIVLGVALMIFHTVFIHHWVSYKHRIVRSHLWHEADSLIDRITQDSRAAHRLEILDDESFQLARFFDIEDTKIVTYRMTSEGFLQMNKTEEEADDDYVLLSSHLDFENSAFMNEEGTKTVDLNLTLLDHIFSKRISVGTSTEIYLRN